MARTKKEDEFYTLLKEFAALIVETSEEYAGIVHDFPNSISRVPQMKVYETNWASSTPPSSPRSTARTSPSWRWPWTTSSTPCMA